MFHYIKRFNITSITRDREYDVTQGTPGSRIVYFTANPNGEAEVDAIVVLMGTNDFNSSVPVGTWFAEKEEQVMAARGETKKLETRKRRVPIMTNDTYKGRN